MLAEHLKRHWPRLVISLAILAVFLLHASKVHKFDFLDRMEAIAYDARILFTMPSTVDDRVVIVDIDEKSLEAEGRWPWPRDRLALMVDQLFDKYQVAVVGFDVVFAEPEEVSGLRVLDELSTIVGDEPRFQSEQERIRRELDHDAAFARSLDGRAVILGYFFEGADASGRIPKVGVLPPPVFVAGQFTGRKIPFVSAPGYAANLGLLQEMAAGAGHFLTIPDIDGVLRRVPMLHEFEENYYESLSLAVARQALRIDKLVPGFPQDSKAGKGYSVMEWLQLGGLRIPVDDQVQSLIPYRGRKGSFPYVSAVDVITGAADPAALDDRIVLIGTTAKGLLDLRATPVQPDYPGVEAHANLIVGILDGSLKDNPAYTVGAEVVLLGLSGIIMAVILPILSPLWAAAITVFLLLGIIGVNVGIWEMFDFVFPLATGLLAVLAMFLFNMTYGYFFEQRGKRQLAGLFGQYVPPELVDEMSLNPDEISMESESRDLTVMFSDVRASPVSRRVWSRRSFPSS